MHVLDGYVPSWVVATGFAGAAVLTAATLPALKRASAPRVAMITSAFFVSSVALKFPVGVTSVHLSLLGLAGVVLGRASFPAILVGLALQLLLFHHGGYTTLGVNACVMGLGALAAAACYQSPRPRRVALRAGLAAGVGTLVALGLYAAVLLTAGRALEAVAWATLGFHAPVLVLEVLVTGFAVSFLDRVQPELVRAPSQRLQALPETELKT